jgi:hypothetical protein
MPGGSGYFNGLLSRHLILPFHRMPCVKSLGHAANTRLLFDAFSIVLTLPLPRFGLPREPSLATITRPVARMDAEATSKMLGVVNRTAGRGSEGQDGPLAFPALSSRPALITPERGRDAPRPIPHIAP